MFTINWGKIDKFYILFVVVMVLMAAMVIYAFKGMFSSFITAYEIGQDSTKLHVKVDKEKLDSAYNFAFDKEIINLELK